MLQFEQRDLAIQSPCVSRKLLARPHHPMAGHEQADRIARYRHADRPGTTGASQCMGQGSVAAGVPLRNADQRVPDALLERAALNEGERGILQLLAGKVAIQRQCGLLQYRMCRIDGDTIQLVYRKVFLRFEPGAGQGICRGAQVKRSQRRSVDAARLQQAMIGNGRHGGLAGKRWWMARCAQGMVQFTPLTMGRSNNTSPQAGFLLMQVAASIFKAYDIRGVVPTTVTADGARAIGRAFGTRARAQGSQVVAVGRDGRLSGPELARALIAGLMDVGVQVIDVGMVTTPMLYFAAHTLCDSGIQVTGSHNPKDHNGFKMVLAGKAIYGDEIQGLREIIEQESWQLAEGGSVRQEDIFPAYSGKIVSSVQLARPMKIVVDSGNGVAGATAPSVFRALGCQVSELYSEVDGDFPNHHPDPSKLENLEDVKRALRETDVELGLAFDGDGDRLGIVTKDGNVIYPDRQMMLFAQDVLQRVPGGTIVFDVKCSQRLAPAIAAAGGVPLMYKTGHSLVKAKMKEVDSPLGGEMSGHIFFKERWFGFDDGTYAGARLLEILSRHDDPSAVLNALPTSYSTPEINVACAEGEPHRLAAELLPLAQQQFAGQAQVNGIDGVRVDWEDGFGLIRASNTTPVLVLRFEGHTPEALERIQNAMLELLGRVKPDAVLGAAAH